jgi:hypothetical protein
MLLAQSWGSFMSDLALLAWVVTLLGGLFLLAIWLIEYDPDFQRAAATRLPVPVISGHALLAVAGLVVWVAYLITDDDDLAWATLAILTGVVGLGTTMAVRWIGVYRATSRPVSAKALAGGSGAGAAEERREVLVPPERHFPVPVIIGHGIFAATTVVLVLLTTLGVGGS